MGKRGTKIFSNFPDKGFSDEKTFDASGKLKKIVRCFR